MGQRVAGHIRVAFEVSDSRATASKLAAAGATVIAEPTVTPWNSLNARLEAPAGLQLTLFTELGAACSGLTCTLGVRHARCVPDPGCAAVIER